MRGESGVPGGGALNLISTNSQTMITMGVFPFQGKTHMVEPGIEPGTSWLVVRRSEHQATRLVKLINVSVSKIKGKKYLRVMTRCY